MRQEVLCQKQAQYGLCAVIGLLWGRWGMSRNFSLRGRNAIWQVGHKFLREIVVTECRRRSGLQSLNGWRKCLIALVMVSGKEQGRGRD